MIADYTEILQEIQKTMKEIDAATRCPAADDHNKIMEHATHLLKVTATMYATAKLNAEMEDVR